MNTIMLLWVQVLLSILLSLLGIDDNDGQAGFDAVDKLEDH